MRTILVGARAVMVVILQTALLLLAMALAFAPFAAAPSALGPTWGYLVYLLYPLLLCLLLAFSHKWLNRLPLASLGFSWRRLPSRLALGLGIGTASVLGIVALTAAWRPGVALELSGSWGSPTVLLMLLADVWETGFTEELLVRGYLLPALVRRGIGPHPAVLVSVLLFTLAHFQVRPLWWLLPIAAAGFLLSYLYYAAASIWAPVGCHLAMNLVFGLISRAILLRAAGMSDNLASLAVTQCAAYLLITALVICWHRRQLASGVSDFPTPRLLAP